MKGITPIIGVIVLLLIVIALAGSAYVFLFGTFSGLTSHNIRIVYGSQEDGTIIINNIGTESVNPIEDLTITVNGQGATVLTSGSIAPGESKLIEFDSPIKGEDLNVRIASPTNTVNYNVDIIDTITIALTSPGNGSSTGNNYSLLEWDLDHERGDIMNVWVYASNNPSYLSESLI